jgi:hypothetical protein
MELEADYQAEISSESGKEVAYTVEARYATSRPVQIANQIFDNRWRTVQYVDSPIGVPTAHPIRRQTQQHGMYGYSAAQALRWWLHAEADASMNGICLETRLIKHEITYSSKAVAVSQHCIIGGDDRSNCVPDWGKKSST